ESGDVEGHAELVVGPSGTSGPTGGLGVQLLLLGVGPVGGSQRQLQALLLGLVPELHERRGDGRVHDDRTTVDVGGAVQGAQAHLDAGALVVGGGGAVVAGAVRAGQRRRRLRQRGDVHAGVAGAGSGGIVTGIGAFGDLADLPAGGDRGALAAVAVRVPGRRGAACGRAGRRLRVAGLVRGFGAAGLGHGGAGVLVVERFGVGDAFFEGDDTGPLVLLLERLGGLGDRVGSGEVVAGGLLGP